MLVGPIDIGNRSDETADIVEVSFETGAFEIERDRVHLSVLGDRRVLVELPIGQGKLPGPNRPACSL